MSTLFISDLHLDASHAQLTDLFRHFMNCRATKADALYVLGDLFEVWLGDDDDRPAVQEWIQILRECAETGVPVYVMRGNRDFLLDKRFAERTVCRLLDEPAVIDLEGEPTLILHGDSLCTDDTAYQEFRDVVRSRAWQKQFLAKPLEERIQIAREFRDKSREETRRKPETIMDVNEQAVESIMREYRVRRMIHGHTHRPAVHEFSLDGRSAERIVLGDWDDSGSVLECDAQGCRLLPYTVVQPSRRTGAL